MSKCFGRSRVGGVRPYGRLINEEDCLFFCPQRAQTVGKLERSCFAIGRSVVRSK
ncbi:hypothetical protein QUB68_13515 [Microcoleus sp. A006_D1]|uniref:hypothetical protein n=1 Tax=Microcoleus sp. A006_D1 TaxID=3055267 RepID=UPI002FCF5A04